MPVAPSKRAEATKKWRQANPEKWKQLQKDWRDANKEKLKGYWLKQYGLTVEQYNAMWEAQGRKCACCGTDTVKQNSRRNNWHVDHDHSTGEVRGIICHTCSTLLGMLGDSLTGVKESCNMFVRYLTK